MRKKSTKVDENEFKKILQVKKMIEKIVGVDDLTSPCRVEELTAARALMVYYCKSIGMIRENIAPIVGRRPSSIHNMVESHKSWLKCWTKYKNWYNEFNTKIYEIQD